MTSHTEQVDVVVVGLGPGGEAVADPAGAGRARGGRRSTARLVGGECPYYGCIPSKMMIRAADVARRGPAGPGLRRREHRRPRLGAGARADPRRGDHRLGRPDRRRPARGRGGDVRPRRRAADRAAHRRGRRRRRTRASEGRRAEHRHRARRAADRRARGHAVLDQPRRAPARRSCPARWSSSAAGAIGAELAQAFARFGVRVTVLEVADRILAPEEPEASALVADVFGREGIQVLTGATIASVVVRRRRSSPSRLGDGQTLQRREAAGRGRPPAEPRRPRPRHRRASTRAPASRRGRRARCGPARGCGRSATSPARARSRTCRCTRPRSRCATSSARTVPRRRTTRCRT